MSQFDVKMTELADAIKVKNTSVSGKLSVQGMIDAVDGIKLGGTGDSTAEYGIVDADGNFQAIDLSGDAPVDTGDAQTMQELIMFNTGHDEPEYPAAGGGGSAIQFYKCSSYTPNADAYTKYYVTLADAPIAEANGTYVRTKWVDDETLQENMWDYYIVASTWKNENGYVLREDIGFEEYSYSIEDANGKTVYWLEYYTSQRLTNYSSDDWMDYATDDFTQLTFSAWQTAEMPATTESWSGYKVEQNKDTGVWTATDTLVENMQVLYQTPKVGEIYSADTSIRVKKLYNGASYIIPADGLVFFAPLATDYANLVNEEQAVIQGGQFTTYNGLRCVYLNGSEYIKWADDSNLPTGAESCSLFILVSPQEQSEWRTYISMGQEKRDHVNVSLGAGVFLEWGGTPLSVDGKWHSLCLVRNNQGEASAYIDGTFNASGTRDGILPTPSCMCVGANMEASYIQKVKSYVAYVAAYDRELSAAEIVEIHNTLMQGVQQ